MTQDKGVRDMLAFMIARDTMHENQWLAAIEELEADGLEESPVPSNFPLEREDRRVAYQFWNCSEGTDSAEGRWAKGSHAGRQGHLRVSGRSEAHEHRRRPTRHRRPARLRHAAHAGSPGCGEISEVARLVARHCRG